MTRDELLSELEIMEAVQEKMRELLSGVACAVKGPSQGGKPHDWHDLPELVQKLVVEHKHLKSWWQDHLDRTAGTYDQVADAMAATRQASFADGFQRGVTATLQRLEGRLRPHSEPDVVDPDEVI